MFSVMLGGCSSDEDDFMVDVGSDGRVAAVPGADGEVHGPDYSFRSFPKGLDPSNTVALDQIRAAARLCDMCFSNATHWVPASAAPRSSLEALALNIFRLHTKGVSYDPSKSGAEWWVQIRPTKNKSTELAMKGGIPTTALLAEKKPAEAQGESKDAHVMQEDPIKWHWDKVRFG